MSAGPGRRYRLLVVLAAAPPALLAFARPPGSGDYALTGLRGGDNAGPALVALAHLHLGAAAGAQPMMGLTSLLLRAPAVALAPTAAGLGYTLGALLCLLPLGLLLGWALTAVEAPVGAVAGRPRATVLLVACTGLIVLAAPPIRAALASGHPEEVLTATLACATVLAAQRGRPTLAGAAAGLAIGTKQWALIALPPVLWALAGRRARIAAALTAAVTGALACGLLPLLDPVAFTRAAAAVGGQHTVNLASLWWPLGHRIAAAASADTTAHWLPLGLGRTPALALGVGAALLALHRAPDLRRSPLAVLALLAIARCAADPWDLDYYWVAVLVPLLVLETARLRRVPLGTALLAVALTINLDSSVRIAPAGHYVLTAVTAVAAALVVIRAAAADIGPRERAFGRPGVLKLA